jgi:hypothetical protein
MVVAGYIGVYLTIGLLPSAKLPDLKPFSEEEKCTESQF